MYTYALKCLETDYTRLLTLAEALNVIEIVDYQVNEKTGGMWDYIGYKYTGDIPLEGETDTRTRLELDGVPYVHINVRTRVNVREKAEQMAIDNPEIAVALSQIPRFFIVDAEGNAVFPNFPLRVFL